MNKSFSPLNQLFVILPDLKLIIGTVYIPPASSIYIYQEHIIHVEDIKNFFGSQSYFNGRLQSTSDYMDLNRLRNLPGLRSRLN